MSTGVLFVQTPTGQDAVEWDTEMNGGGPLDPCHARATFEKLVSRGSFAFAETVTEKGDVTREQIRKGGFDPETQSKVTIVPQIAGGR